MISEPPIQEIGELYFVQEGREISFSTNWWMSPRSKLLDIKDEPRYMFAGGRPQCSALSIAGFFFI